jgi:hypothetical protein
VPIVHRLTCNSSGGWHSASWNPVIWGIWAVRLIGTQTQTVQRHLWGAYNFGDGYKRWRRSGCRLFWLWQSVVTDVAVRCVGRYAVREHIIIYYMQTNDHCTNEHCLIEIMIVNFMRCRFVSILMMFGLYSNFALRNSFGFKAIQIVLYTHSSILMPSTDWQYDVCILCGG